MTSPVPAATCCCAMLVMVLLALSSCRVAADLNASCIARGTKAVTSGAVAHSAPVTLVWGSQPARAAAALLRAALLAAGHPPHSVSLQEHRAAHRLCSLLASNLTQRWPSVVAVSVASEGRCAWTNQLLEVVGSGAAPTHPVLHTRLARTHAHPPTCTCLRPPNLSALRDRAWLRECGFLSERGSENVTVYLVESEWEEESEEVRERVCDGKARVRCERTARAELSARVQGGEPHSFFFFDAQLWRDVSGVVAPSEPPPGAALLVADKKALVEHAPALLVLLESGTFQPRASDLRLVLDRERHVQPEHAACDLVPIPAAFDGWVMSASRPSKRLAAALVCRTDDVPAYTEAARHFLPYHVQQMTRLDALHARFLVNVIPVECERATVLAELVVEWYRTGHAWRMFGVVIPAHLAPPAVAEANAIQMPLVTYTPALATEVAGAAVLRAATGSLEHLAAQVGALISECGWTRLGVVSEESEAARAVSAALARMPGLSTHEESAAAPQEAVRALRNLDTRVFFVNCEAEGAARVLAAGVLATEPSDRHVWIMRAYNAADAGTAALRPLAVSFSWRGGEELARHWPSAERAGSHLRNLDSQWKNRSWPQHAAAMLDALITLGVGYERLVTAHPRVLDEPRMQNKTSYFWEGVQRKPVAGVVSELQYDESGVRHACVYLEQWGAAARPERLAAWCGDERPDRCPVPAVPDGPYCILPGTDDPYKPRCNTGAWCGGAAGLACALMVLAWAAHLLRRWVARRDLRLERAATARVLARREAAFASLAPHSVPRADLRLGDELGAGRFGRVRRAEVRGPRRTWLVVAVKELREGASPAEESQFLREARLLAALQHEHVVRFRGVCWEGGPPLLLMELALFGDLRRYLRARRHLAGGTNGEAHAVAAEALTRLAREAAAALEYLGARGLVHRDVRAANCLVDARRSLMLGDFGLARDTGAPDGEYCCRGRALFPVLWMAPESLARGVATPASDAWAFGVLALELVTLGARPWGHAAPEAAVRAVLAGGLPPVPRAASTETRALLAACWRRAPAARPTAARLAAWLRRRPTALRPTLPSDLDEPDCDSGIGDPDAPAPSPAPADPCSVSLLKLHTCT